MDEATSRRLDELIEDSRALVAALKKKGDRSHELLAEGLYKKRTHFITELLQNAEDEGAHHVLFTLNKNELVFSHDAPHLFDFDDIKSISNFGDNQKKKDKPNAIGRFGIGFKSVYSITDKPRIVSGDFDITIQDMCVPERTDLQFNHYDNDSYETKIILSFKDTEKENILKQLDSEFQNLEILCMLFLSNITLIEWRTPNSNGKYQKIPDDKNQVMTLQSGTKAESFLVFEKIIDVDNKKLRGKIAFSLNGNKSAVTPRDKSPLFAFFPTTIETNLSFLLHAPFHTTESRETLDETDNRNNILINELGVLFAESLSDLKRRQLVNVDFLNMLPIDADVCSRSPIYNILYTATKNEFQKDTNKFIPTTEKNVFCSVNDAMLLGSAELAELLTGKQAKMLFDRESWVTSEITENKTETKKLYQYFYSALAIPNYDLRKFAAGLTKEFLLEQSNNWIEKFYKTVFQKAEGLWEKDAKNPVLRKRPIIRIEKDGKREQVMPFADDGKPNVYLPTETKTNYSTVLRSIANDKEVAKFLKAFGLDYPDVFAEINEYILPKFKTGEMYEGYLDDIATILTASPEKAEKYNQLIDDLKQCRFILGENYVTNEKKLLQYNKVYFPSEALTRYFENNLDIYFVSSFDSFDDESKEKYNELLKEIGVHSDCPWRIRIEKNYTNAEKHELVHSYDGNSSRSETWIDYDLEGLDVVLKHKTKEISVLLWSVLSHKDVNFFKGKAKWFYYYEYNRQFDAKFLRDLRKEKWLFIDDSSFAPYEITFEELPNEYKTDIVSASEFANLLNFKLDEDKEYENSHKGKRVISENQYEEYLKLKAEKETAEKEKKAKEVSDTKIEFNPSVNAADAPIRISLFNGKSVARPYVSTGGNSPEDSSGGSGDASDETPNIKNSEESRENDDNSQSDATNSNNPGLMKEVGRWGENYIFRVLSDEIKNQNDITIIDLNTDGKTGVGADFEIRKNGDLIRLVEVKTTTEQEGNAVIVSGTQWETARNEYNLGDGDMYWIYCVFNAGKENVRYVPVKNPIEQWKEGRVMADPVNFVINSN
jgi:hypothetical protein